MQKCAREERMDRKKDDLACDGLGTLAVRREAKRRLDRALAEARRLSALEIDAGDGLRRLIEDTRLIEAAVPAEVLRGLPACGGVVRLSVIAEGLLRGGELELTEARLTEALSARPLTLRELWSVPVALRVYIAEALSRVCGAIAGGAAECARAEDWLDHPGRLRRAPSADFVEHALRRCAEENHPRPRALMEDCLRRHGMSAALLIRQAHDARAHRLLRLDNLMGALRCIDRLDWQACFEALSEVDAELRRDPAGVYPLMDVPSRRAVLAQAAAVARAARCSEIAVARHAVSAARAHRKGPSEALRLDGMDAVDARETCCHWLCDDAGRAELLKRLGRPRARLPRLVPDPSGAGCIAATLLLTAAIAALTGRFIRMPWLCAASVPAAWAASDAIINRIFPLFFRPARLLKLEVEKLPDAWRTLIVTPVLLPDVARADAACDNLEALGCLEDDPNLACLLLGDFADADHAGMPGDDAIVERVRARIHEMNRRAGREKYFYLHRPRTLLKADHRYMGRDRKRGALMDLNRLLLGGASAFGVEGAAADALRGRYAYVVTLDADTRMLPGTAHALVGALAHPMNRRYAVLQPRMEVAPASVSNRFALLFSGAGGLDTYPTCAASLWMDLTGAGIYGGKGVYRVDGFQRAVDGRLPEGRILSHDLIEGALAGAGFVGDIALFDGCPATLSGWMKRQHRWTRGDWQLLPLIFSPKRPLHIADRFRMLDNLMRSLRAPALWLMLMAAAWTGRAEGAAAGMLFLFQDAILHPADADNWRRGLIGLATLPLTAHRMADAALRALWRVFVSHRRLMDWVPSADAEGAAPDRRGNRIAALLTLPGLLAPDGAPLALALFMLFSVGADWVRDTEDQPVDPAGELTPSQRDMLRALARDTWRFFSESVTPDGPALPPDNLQIDPPAPAARRTSPTNVGLYLLSCVAARRLGFIDPADCAERVRRALDAVESMEKWRGHLFNWIDIDTLAPLHPRYVSAVDSGNLAACAIACARMIDDDGLSARLDELAAKMDFTALYDEDRQLFHIGMDVDDNRLSASHYDLLASESRILSYTALMLHQVPLKHWARLGRRCVRAGGGATLVSWSGTLFEYLMPELLMRAPALSLLGGACRRAVRAQMSSSAPWGVSESGYHAFDARMNYQYRAFGLKALALGGMSEGGVIAPYASALALSVRPGDAAENLARMARLGWRDRLGFYEAADARHPDAQGKPALVKSHMAHHQGMTLCAVYNALTGDSLARGFMRDPRARALGLLLEERPACRARLKPLPECAEVKPKPHIIRRTARNALDVHLLCGQRAQAWVCGDGAAHYARGGIDATRFYGDLIDRPDAAKVYLRVDGAPVIPRCACTYDAGSARFEGTAGPVSVDMTLSLSPEDDALYRAVTLKNSAERRVAVEVMDALPVSLAAPRDFRAHPAFQLLFVESEYYGDNALLFRRRPRNPGERCPALLHAAFAEGTVRRESRYENIYDRAGVARFDWPGGVGTVLNPASALKVACALDPGESREICFALKLCDGPEDCAVRCLPARAAALNRARAEAMLGFLGIAPALYHRLDRLSALLLDPGLAARAKSDHAPAPGQSREALWALGISGDEPLLSMVVSDPRHAPAAQAMLRAQGFYRAMGLKTDLAFIDAGPGGYDQPVATLLRRMIDASPLEDKAHVYVLTGLTLAQVATVRRASAVALSADRDFSAQARPLLDALEPSAEAPGFDPGESLPEPVDRFMDNGYGGFTDHGYSIDVRPGRATPAPWCNLLATDGVGMLLTERGGGFVWCGNSRFCRLTGYRGDPLRERFGLSLSLVTDRGGQLPLLPGVAPGLPFRVEYSPDAASYSFSAERASGRVTFTVHESAVLIDVSLALRRLRGTLRASADWLMGAERADAVWLHTWTSDGALFASGTAAGVGFLACDSLDAWCGEALFAPVREGDNHIRLALGWAEDLPAARRLAQLAREGALGPAQKEDNGALVVETPDGLLNRMMNAFLPHQVRASRVLGRTGYCQPGGAYGFRDQLQDMLALIPLEPGRVRRHLLACAGRQFIAGDALHWWHMPYLGVRTRIRDDRLFLPWVTAEYVRQTGDSAVLSEVVPYLEDVPLPDDREDVFCAMTPSGASGTLHDHCMRAFRASDAAGAHGLALMGAGDWNDGMNRVGCLGQGESVWLSQFLAACADRYAEISPVPADAEWLRALARRHRGAAELYGWDGGWYLRAYADDGTPLGGAQSPGCRIDLIAQAWAVLGGLSPERCRMAVDAAWEMLVDEESGLIRLLTPPFGAEGIDPGYIRGYPGGVRENGAQYTHAACWLLLALIRMGDADRAHRALRMLLPANHADTPERARRYRVEPYVTAADVYALPGETGRGGWTWYTGSAAWLYTTTLELLGYERRGDRVRLNALLGPWPEVSVTLRYGESRYRLVCAKGVEKVTLDGVGVGDDFIPLTDDGQPHEALFPPR